MNYKNCLMLQKFNTIFYNYYLVHESYNTNGKRCIIYFPYTFFFNISNFDNLAKYHL